MTINNNIFTTGFTASVVSNVVLLPVIFINLLLLSILLGKKMGSF